MRMHRRVILLAVVAVLPPGLLVACASSSTSGSGASCAGPHLDAQPPSGRYGAPAPTASPGGRLTIYGHWYTSTCNDTGGSLPLEPLAPVHLTLTLPGGRAEPLGESKPHGQDMGFKMQIRIPPGTSAGIATIRDDQAHPETYRFKVRASGRRLRLAVRPAPGD
jgi:hypothetical protein